MSKRDIFAELLEGFGDLAAERQGKITLRTHKVEQQALEPASGEEIAALRERLNMSQPVFAHVLRAAPATLKNWEQNRSRPNDQATLLIRLLARHPETLEMIRALA
ncbi:hypothetical protein PKB_1585 [Pseudomonas knackmussii B13]|uniref:HTH cro/C1-type domain-containing protein n=1 Tax=Pseudomonas knackmussii (strain DSM 6978 / CCUG 54928 / LMG 23759 / B13) TaxID=1301098 RepID=A0A024HDH7_PSEKB|nr:type II toxin-antitoxin system MqsA family antitoxin [Pseudomonas knackmussii]CDF82946.1 hypothetical protein PKB_1585 [Pseudomonas knackmussii B13]